MRYLTLGIVLSVAVLNAGLASAQSTAGCAPDVLANRIVRGRTISVPVFSGPAGMSNIAQTDLTGGPLQIYLRPDFYSLKTITKQLVLYHECGHAMLRTSVELTAEFYAGELFCVAGYSRSDLAAAQTELRQRGLTTPQVIESGENGYKSQCGG